MKVRIEARKLRESLGYKELFDVLLAMGQAHDKIMEAQDLLEDLEYRHYDDDEGEDAAIPVLREILEDLEATLSEQDYMGEDDSVEAFRKKYDLD